MTIKEKIEEGTENYLKKYDGISAMDFQAGSDFTLKAVIEMLEERQIKCFQVGELEATDELTNIIDLLKSEV